MFLMILRQKWHYAGCWVSATPATADVGGRDDARLQADRIGLQLARITAAVQTLMVGGGHPGRLADAGGIAKAARSGGKRVL